MILNETVASKPEWVALQGKTLDGGYELLEVLETNDTVAQFRVRVLGDSSVAAYASFHLAQGAGAAEQLQVWQDIGNLKHPNLQTPLGSGWMKLNADYAIYVVWSTPDETLSELLNDRGLTDEEGGELLKSLGAGLRCLHSHGFVHGALSPEMVVAVGELIQISTACTRRINCYPNVDIAAPRYLAPEAATANVTVAADIWCLGATIFESLVQKKYEAAWFGDLDRIRIGALLQRCLEADPQARAPLSELIDPPWSMRAEAAVVAPSARVRPVKVTRQPIGTKRIRPLDPSEMQLVKFDPAYGIERVKSRTRARRPSLWRPIVAGAAALVLLVAIIWLVIVPKLQSIPESDALDDQPRQRKTAWPTKTIGASDGQPAAPTDSRADRQTWRLVLGAYEHEGDANRRVQLLNKTHPDLKVEKLPKSATGPFFVVAGDPMSQADAKELRKKALRIGISRASYVSDLSK